MRARRVRADVAIGMVVGLGLLALRAAAGADPGLPETVSVGHAGNKADKPSEQAGSVSLGSVPYTYRIGKYEVTNDQYCEFLNAVAAADINDLYSPEMAEKYGGITRSGARDRYTYAVKEGMGRKPVNFVKWSNCARYANWLTNGRGAGDTENGSYEITGVTVDIVAIPDHAKLAKGDVVKWVVASENEWYKAAYYDPRKMVVSSGLEFADLSPSDMLESVVPGYWPYPGRGKVPPPANLNTDAPSDCGSYEAASAFGTFDQGGNVWEYTEPAAKARLMTRRGGSFALRNNAASMHADTRGEVWDGKRADTGFRVVALGGE